MPRSQFGHNNADSTPISKHYRAVCCRPRETALWRRRWWKRAKVGSIDAEVSVPCRGSSLPRQLRMIWRSISLIRVCSPTITQSVGT